jgi:hypothetical protein
MTKRQYLNLMGIDVWQKRRPRAALPVEPEIQAEQPRVASIDAAASGDGAAVLANVRASLNAAEAQRPTPSQPAAVADPQPAEVKSKPLATEPPPEFYLTLSHFPGLTMVNIYPNGFASIPGNHQRFLNTLYFSLTQQKSVSEVTEFRWPLVKSSQISQSRAEAQKVLGRHLGNCQPELLVFGTEASNLLGTTASAAYVEETVRDRRLVVVEDAELYFREPVRRQALWQFLASLRRRVRSSL